MSDKPIQDWDPRDEAVLRDQRGAYDEMRERCPVAHSDFLGWSIFKHEDISSVLADPEAYSSTSNHRAVPNGMDPPEHTLYRRVLEPYFEMDYMAAFEPGCRRVAADRLQELTARGEVEFVSEFAEPFSIASLCTFLGWPRDTWEQLRGWTHGNQQASLSRDREAGRELARTFAGYVEHALAIRCEAGLDGFDDVTAGLMQAEVDGAPLTNEDIVSVLRNWTAGHGTVAAALGLLVLYLAEHPETQHELRRTPTLLPSAIDEILRVDDPLVANRRTTTREVTIGDRTIGAGEKLTLMWIAANRDGQTFDAPGDVRFDRDPDGNVVFGEGIHDCVGAPLARLELRVALDELLARSSHFELAGDQPPSRAVYPGNGLTTMNIRLS